MHSAGCTHRVSVCLHTGTHSAGTPRGTHGLAVAAGRGLLRLPVKPPSTS